MTYKRSKGRFHMNRRDIFDELKGELSSKSGKKYEDIASFYIIEQFDKVIKKKIKPKKITFNSPEDLTIIDNLGGMLIKF